MAIREEYQHLEAEIKKEKERSRILDLLSVGVTPEKDKKFIFKNASLFNDTGLDYCDCISSINTDFVIIFAYACDRWGKIDIRIDRNEVLGHYPNFLIQNYPEKTHDFFKIFAILKHLEFISEKLQSDPESKREKDIIERTERSIKLCRVFLSYHENALIDMDDISAIPVDAIKKSQLSFFKKQKETFYDNIKEKLFTIKQTRGLSDQEFEHYCEELSEKNFYHEIFIIIQYLIIYLLFLDDEPKYIRQLMGVMNRLSSIKKISTEDSIACTNHTIDDIFILIKKFPTKFVKNLFMYFKTFNVIAPIQYSSIIEAINTSDLNLFKSSISNDIVSSFDNLYHVFELINAVSLLLKNETEQEEEISTQYISIISNNITESNPILKSELMESDEAIVNNSIDPTSPQFLEKMINNGPVLLGFFTYFYKKHRQLVYPKDRQYFDRIFTQEPYKEYCDKALLELDKQYQNNKSLDEFWRLLSGLKNQDHSDESICDVPTEDVIVSELESEPNECEMKENPFGGLNDDAKKICNYDKKGYVGLFIDYLIDRGYIDCENKDAFVCCLCEDMIPESALDNLKYNVKNKEGISNANIVTMMIVTLTKCKKKNNQIVVDGRIISKGCMYFNKGQINNGELEEWCLFWPFLKDRIKKGKRPLFQKIKSFLDSEIEDAKKRVEQFLNEYDEYKKGNPHSTKLDFIKMKHE